jgi:hypothetical protein
MVLADIFKLMILQKGLKLDNYGMGAIITSRWMINRRLLDGFSLQAPTKTHVTFMCISEIILEISPEVAVCPAQAIFFFYSGKYK